MWYLGVAMSIGSVVTGPFMMENSDENGASLSVQLLIGIADGRCLCGKLGGWILADVDGEYQNVSADSSLAYAGALLVIGVVSSIGLLPVLFIRRNRVAEMRDGIFAPITFAKENPRMLGKLFTPLLIVSIGAGLFVPFMNVFFREQHNQSDAVVGSLMAWGSLAMGVGLIIAPPLADRLGKLRLVVITQALSIPFMIMLGFSPLFLDECAGVLCAHGADEYEQPDLPEFCTGAGQTHRQGHGCQPAQYGVVLWAFLQPLDQRLFAGVIWFWAALPDRDWFVFGGDFPLLGFLAEAGKRGKAVGVRLRPAVGILPNTVGQSPPIS